MPDPAAVPDAVDARPAVPTRRGTVAAVILAAGEGSRFAGARHKLLTEIDGVPLVRRAVDAACGAGYDEVIVVTGAVDLLAVLPVDVTVIHNDRWEDGQATSVQAAVGYAGARRHKAIVVGLGDQPGVGTAAWEALADVDADLAVAEFSGERRPPTRIGAAMWNQLPVSGDEGARGLLRRRPELVVGVACDGDPADVDTVEDLARWS